MKFRLRRPYGVTSARDSGFLDDSFPPRPATPEACGALLGEYDGDGRAGPRSAGSPVRTHRLLTHKHPAALRRAPVRPRGERDAGPAGGLPCGSVARRLRNVRVSARSPPTLPRQLPVSRFSSPHGPPDSLFLVHCSSPIREVFHFFLRRNPLQVQPALVAAAQAVARDFSGCAAPAAAGQGSDGMAAGQGRRPLPRPRALGRPATVG